MDDRHITAFAETLVPEAFERPHSAYRVEVVQPVEGPGEFDWWVRDRIRAMIAYRYPAGHRPVRAVIVEGSDGLRWRWDDSPCCLPEWTARRVRREAAPIPEPWLFAIELPWPEPTWEAYDPQQGAVVELPEPRWECTAWQATWYAEARGRGEAAVAAGAVILDYDPELDTDTQLARIPLPVDGGLPRIFHKILYRHPARKQHPLRRRRGRLL